MGEVGSVACVGFVCWEGLVSEFWCEEEFFSFFSPLMGSVP